MMSYWLIKTTLGWCGLITDNDIIRKLILPSHKKSLVLKKLGCGKLYMGIPDASSHHKYLSGRFLKDLNKYFNGVKVDFRYKIDLREYSNFEQKVYKSLRDIPYGKTRTYKWVAEKSGYPKASRAVGNALAKNPLPIIIPCHRVIRSDGSIGNFSAVGGTKLKEKLLKIEGAI